MQDNVEYTYNLDFKYSIRDGVLEIRYTGSDKNGGALIEREEWRYDRHANCLWISPWGDYDNRIQKLRLVGIRQIFTGAFQGLRVREVEFDSYIKVIGIDAFKDCKYLREINIPDGVRVQKGAFQGCSSLKSVRLPNDLNEINGQVFRGCSNLKEINIPDSVKYIYDYAFLGCYKLEKVKMPRELLSIGIKAFAECHSLHDVQLPNGLSIIDSGAFFECKNLNAINIPSSVSSIVYNAFKRCPCDNTVHEKAVNRISGVTHSYDGRENVS